MKVRFTPTGRTQFLAAVAYIRRENPRAAAMFRQRAEDALRRLQRFPESGRIVPEFPDLPYREVIVRSYRFFYRVRDPIVWVVAVRHAARLPENPGEGLLRRAVQTPGENWLGRKWSRQATIDGD